MKTPNILTLVGGISVGSINKKLFYAVKNVIGEEAKLVLADISKLPFFSQDLENDPPDAVSLFKDQIRQADAILFITPEYNHSMTAPIKNAIDWGTRPYPLNLWDQIPAATMGASIGNIGSFGAQNHLRQVLNYVNMYIMNQPEFYMNGSKAFDQNGNLIDEKSIKQIEKMWAAFKAWIQKHEDLTVRPYKSFVPKDIEGSRILQH